MPIMTIGFPRRRLARLVAATIAACLSLSPADWAIAKESASARSWEKRIQAVDQELRDQDWEKAERDSRALLSDMTDAYIRGPGTAGTLGSTIVMRALALTGQDKLDEALWQWEVACQLYPEAAALDLSPYGIAAERLRAFREKSAAADSPPIDLRSAPDDKTLQLPRLKHKENFDFPEARRWRIPEINVVVQVTVDVDGHVRHPVVLKSEPGLTLDYKVLEAVRHWEYEPATRNGEPVAVYFTIRATFNSDPAAQLF